jgi:pyruvate kinase
MNAIRKQHMQRVKIVATIGPASEGSETLSSMLEAGVDVVRMNFSHGNHEGHRRQFDWVRNAAGRLNRHVAVLADLSGPKIRTGKMKKGGVTLSEGAEIVITPEPIVGDEHRIFASYPALARDVSTGDLILLDDGRLELIVTKTVDKEVHCRVEVGGPLTDHKGINIPGASLSIEALTEKDRADLLFAQELGVDYIALSFVRRASDVAEAKALAGEIPVIAKIEKPEAIANLTDIIAVADGIMVARGDLGVEAGAEKVPMLQKRIIREAGDKGIPVIVATQMMESMMVNPMPTRAEVSDVANAVVDGVDAVMLSGETAVGKHPVDTVRRMAAIIDAVESSEHWRPASRVVEPKDRRFSGAIARAAVAIAADFDIKAIAVFTESGRSAHLVSANRPNSVIVALSRHPRVLRRLALRWGVIPIDTEWHESLDAMVAVAKQCLVNNGFAAPGDSIAVAFGRDEANAAFQTDTLKLLEIPS